MLTETLKQLGEQVKSIRKKERITQEQLAEKINVHPTYIAKIEGGNANPSTITLFKLSRALNTNLYEVFEFDK